MVMVGARRALRDDASGCRGRWLVVRCGPSGGCPCVCWPGPGATCRDGHVAISAACKITVACAAAAADTLASQRLCVSLLVCRISILPRPA